MEMHVRSGLRTAAALGSLQFTAQEIEAIQRPSDMNKSAYTRVVKKLDDIRDQVPNAKFAYIFRKTDDPRVLSFVADADGIKTDAELDLNKNGSVDSDEEPGFPGDQYDISQDPIIGTDAFQAPTVGEVSLDQWGALISGFAPIHDTQGHSIAILGIDMDAQEYLTLSQSVLSPMLLLLVFVVGVLMTSYIGVIIWKRRLENMRELDRERSRLMDLTFHQIGAPLSGMRWWIEILHDEAINYPPIQDHEGFTQINVGLDRMTEVIVALSQASKLRRKELELKKEQINVKESINTTLETLQTELTYREQDIELTVDASYVVMFDRLLLYEVIQAIMKNAMYYSPARSRIFIKAEKKDDTIEVTIRDEGYGIASEDLEGIFREMRRGKEAYKHKPVGNGLGLYITKGIIEHGGGTMWIESKKGNGTTVHFTLPLAYIPS